MNFLRRFFHGRVELSEGELPIVAPSYRCRLTGEDFGTFDESLQERALERRKVADALRGRASKIETSEAAPLRDVGREAKRA